MSIPALVAVADRAAPASALTVRVEQATGQVDPTRTTSIRFAVTFSESVRSSTFTSSDLRVSGPSGAVVSAISALDTRRFVVTVSARYDGTLAVSVPAGRVTGTSGLTNVASTSTDGQVQLDRVAPTVAFNQSTDQPDPATQGTLRFVARFSEPIAAASFTASDVRWTGPATIGRPVSPDGVTWTVPITATGSGTIRAWLPAGAVTDRAGNSSLASTATDNTVTVGLAPPPTTTTVAPTTTAAPTTTVAPTTTAPTTAAPTTAAPTTAAPTTAAPTTTSPGSAPRQPKMVLFQGYGNVLASYLVTHPTEVSSLPFDGLSFLLSANLATTTAHATAHTTAEYTAGFSGMSPATFSKAADSFVLVFSGSPGNVANWSVVNQNFANLATASRAAGLAGIFFDTELYNGAGMWLPSSACPGLTLDACRTQMRTAGNNLVRSVAAAWPTAKIMTTHGPAVGDPLTARYIGTSYSPCPFRDWSNADENKLKESFFFGMVEASIGTSVKVIDGGEEYDIHSPAAASASRTWRKQELPRQSSAMVDSLRSGYGNAVSIAFAVQDDVWCQFNGVTQAQTAAGWQNDLTAVLSASDGYVWAFARNHRWYADSDGRFPHVTQDFIDATRAARAAAGLPRL